MEQFGFSVERAQHYHYLWDITEREVQEEFDRTFQERLSFVLVLKWSQYKRSSIHKYLTGQGGTPEKLKSVNQIVAMCYFQYLEERGFFAKDQEFLYGQLLQQVKPEYEEPIMLYLEMLKIFFPAGLDIATTQQTQDHAKAHDLLQPSTPDRTSILLITRIFSLVPVRSELSESDFALDFDLSQFSSYVATLKFLMQSVFQSIMYRMFRVGRADMALFREA